MTAELWLRKPGRQVDIDLEPDDEWVRLDPDKVVEVPAAAVWSNGIGQNKTRSAIQVKDIITALTDANGTIVSFTQETDQEETP